MKLNIRLFTTVTNINKPHTKALRLSKNAEQILVQLGLQRPKDALTVTQDSFDSFVNTTFIKHLEYQVANSSEKMPPSRLVELSRVYIAYGQQTNSLDVELIHRIFTSIKKRIETFNAKEIVEVLPPSLVVYRGDKELFSFIHNRIEEILPTLSAPQLLGIINIFSRLSSDWNNNKVYKDIEYNKFMTLDLVLPRVTGLLRKYTGEEIADFIISHSLSYNSTEARNSATIAILLPYLHEHYNEISFVQIINVLSALVKIKVADAKLVESIIRDVNQTNVLDEMPIRFTLRLLGSMTELLRASSIRDIALKNIERSIKNPEEWSGILFARAALYLGPQRTILLNLLPHLKKNIAQMSSPEYTAFFVALIRSEFLDIDDETVITFANYLKGSNNEQDSGESLFNKTKKKFYEIFRKSKLEKQEVTVEDIVQGLHNDTQELPISEEDNIRVASQNEERIKETESNNINYKQNSENKIKSNSFSDNNNHSFQNEAINFEQTNNQYSSTKNTEQLKNFDSQNISRNSRDLDKKKAEQEDINKDTDEFFTQTDKSTNSTNQSTKSQKSQTKTEYITIPYHSANRNLLQELLYYLHTPSTEIQERDQKDLIKALLSSPNVSHLVYILPLSWENLIQAEKNRMA